jgi:hypothetical protein
MCVSKHCYSNINISRSKTNFKNPAEEIKEESMRYQNVSVLE